MAPRFPLTVPPPGQRRCCPGADRLEVWVGELFLRLTPPGREPTRDALDAARLALLARWYAERSGAKPKHRDRLTDERGDPCLYGVFVSALERLFVLEQSLAPMPPVRTVKPRRLPTPVVLGLPLVDADETV